MSKTQPEPKNIRLNPAAGHPQALLGAGGGGGRGGKRGREGGRERRGGGGGGGRSRQK